MGGGNKQEGISNLDIRFGLGGILVSMLACTEREREKKEKRPTFKSRSF